MDRLQLSADSRQILLWRPQPILEKVEVKDVPIQATPATTWNQRKNRFSHS